jgi:hypothetical protein
MWNTQIRLNIHMTAIQQYNLFACEGKVMTKASTQDNHRLYYDRKCI